MGSPQVASRNQQSATARAPAGAPNQSASCSDITGLGGDSGPSNCTPSGTPQEISNYQAAARSYLQAAQTVKQSDPNASGQAAAAAQFRKAADAFRLAGEIALARVAADQAQSIETALNSFPSQVFRPNQSPPAAPSPRMAARSSDQSESPAGDAKSCQPVAPAKYWQGTPNAD